MARPEHWERVYQRKAANEVSWFQPEPTLSAALVIATVVLVATFAATAGPIGRVAKLAPAPVLRE